MSSLAAKYDYLEKLTRKVCHSQTEEPKKRAYVPFQGGRDGEGGPPKKKQKKKQKPTKGNNNTNDKKPAPKTIQKTAQKQASATVQNAPQVKIQNGNQVHMQQKTEGAKSEGEFNAVDILRRRLHQKIEESRGQGPPKDPSSEEVQKRRAKRKQERERKKRKRKEFLMKKLAQSASTEAEDEGKVVEAPTPPDTSTETKPAKKDTSSIVFNKVEVGEEYVDKGTKLKEKKKRKVKGTLTPLTGKNYKQLLSRVEARKARLEELREKDEEKAKKEEEKMRWTNILYKAEGMKIKDNEELLRASLKRKEKRKAQRKKKWIERSQHVVEKMQQRQDKRRRNIQKRKQSKIEKRKQRARKKGRVMPEDLKKAAV
ncbi:surfeit locus protein 6 [Colossoma macropomum]|uniref:surfeit locus protein 6 n=1 Tax=Colossoma macropomum TaxID=42526 RepID=UPI00186539AB|nr:surfeit locus protein 6 [Colossoma macropomum]